MIRRLRPLKWPRLSRYLVSAGAAGCFHWGAHSEEGVLISACILEHVCPHVPDERYLTSTRQMLGSFQYLCKHLELFDIRLEIADLPFKLARRPPMRFVSLHPPVPVPLRVLGGRPICRVFGC